jgi:hypothetical protein
MHSRNNDALGSGSRDSAPLPISAKIGALPYLGAYWDHGPFWAATTMIALDFGLVSALMYLEGLPPWDREHYRAFIWNDTIFLPAYLALAAHALKRAPAGSHFYTRPWWHMMLLLLAFLLSLLIETASLWSGQYSFGQQLSPSKLWHTLVFGIVGYWIACSAWPVLVTDKPRWLTIAMLLVLAGAAFNNYRDAVIRPYPVNAHLEGTYLPWRWAPRSSTER